MTATIKFDQTGLPAGGNNRSREDIVAGTVVTITNVNPGTVNTLELLWRPPEDDTAAIIGSGPTYTILPKAGTYGTYRFRLTVDGDIVEHTFDVTSPVLNLPLIAPNEKADPTASLVKNTSAEIAASETNEPFGPFTSGSAWGWWYKFIRWLKKFDDLFNVNTGHTHTGAGENGPKVLHSSLTDDEPEKHRLIDDNTSSIIGLWSSNKIESEFTAVSSGYSRRRAVIDLVDNTASPPSELTGDRYILDFTAGTVHPNWDGAAKGDIVEFNGIAWEATTPLEGYVALVDNQNKDAVYIDDGSPTWELRNVYSRLHSDLTDVSSDQHHAKQHALDSAVDHSALSDNTNFNASTGAHGFLPKLSGIATQFLNGLGQWVTPSGGTGGLQWTTEKTSNYTAADGENVLCNSSGGAFQVDAPASPSNNNKFGVKLHAGSNAITVDGNGKNFDGGASTRSLSTENQWRVWQFSTVADEWLEVGG